LTVVVWEELRWGIAMTVAVMVPAAGLHLWAGVVNRGGFPPDPGRVRRAFLLYPFQSRGATVIRSVLYVWAVLVAALLPGALVQIRIFVTHPGAIVRLVISLVLLVGLRFWAAAVNNRAARRMDTAETTHDPNVSPFVTSPPASGSIPG
jgi:hypothetical protein